mmetsp:Transcript_76826/g.205249  ORF Transcript_76826/g.205249 Transcript_76826/m.205249 type:complete len:127 (-) Transcript_76826:118-498(-)
MLHQMDKLAATALQEIGRLEAHRDVARKRFTESLCLVRELVALLAQQEVDRLAGTQSGRSDQKQMVKASDAAAKAVAGDSGGGPSSDNLSQTSADRNRRSSQGETNPFNRRSSGAGADNYARQGTG